GPAPAEACADAGVPEDLIPTRKRDLRIRPGHVSTPVPPLTPTHGGAGQQPLAPRSRRALGIARCTAACRPGADRLTSRRRPKGVAVHARDCAAAGVLFDLRTEGDRQPVREVEVAAAGAAGIPVPALEVPGLAGSDLRAGRLLLAEENEPGATG